MADSTDSTVVSLDSHPARHAAQRRSSELAEAMRRHPSYLAAQCAVPTEWPARADHGVLSLCSHRDRKR